VQTPGLRVDSVRPVLRTACQLARAPRVPRFARAGSEQD
jgi:hypothetical protein